MFAAFAVLGLVFGFQVENCINTIIYCLIYCFFLWMVSLGLNQSPDMVKYTFHLITEFILINLYCQRKMILGGSRKTMNFIVLPCDIKKP